MVTACSSNTFLSEYSLESLCPFLSIVQSLHSYIPSCGWNLRFSCSAAEGVTEGCILRVLLLTLSLDQTVDQSVSFTIKTNGISLTERTKLIQCTIRIIHNNGKIFQWIHSTTLQLKIEKGRNKFV